MRVGWECRACVLRNCEQVVTAFFICSMNRLGTLEGRRDQPNTVGDLRHRGVGHLKQLRLLGKGPTEGVFRPWSTRVVVCCMCCGFSIYLYFERAYEA